MIKFTKSGLPWLVFIVVCIFATLNPQSNSGGYGFNYAHNALILVAVSLSLISVTVLQNLKLDRSFFVLASLILLMFSPVFWNESDQTSVVLRLSFILFTTFWIYVLPSFEKQATLMFILRSILILILLQCILALVLHFYLVPTGLMRVGGGSRLLGVFLQPNVLASFLATGAVLAGYLYTVDEPRWVSKLSSWSVVLMIAVMVLTESKAGFLGLIIGLFVLIAGIRTLQSKKWKSVVLLVFIGFALGICVQYLDVTLLSGQQRQASAHLTGSQARLDFYIQSFSMIASNPLGVGFGKFAYSFMDSWLTEPSPWLTGSSIISNLFHPHNEILYFGVEGGVVSIIAIALLIVYAIWRAIKNNNLASFLLKLSLLIPISIHAMLEYPFYHSFIHWIIFALFVRMLVGEKDGFSISKLYPVSMGLLLLLFSVSGMHTAYQLHSFRYEPKENIDALGKIVNPWVLKDEIQYGMQVTNLYAANELKLKELIRSELDSSYKVLTMMPQANLIANMVQSHLYLGEEQKANHLLIYLNEFYLGELDRINQPLTLNDFDQALL